MCQVKKKQQLYISLIIVLISIAQYSSKAQSGNKKWHLDKKADGIEIYFRKRDETGLKEVKGIMKMRTSLNSVICLLKDLDNQKKWMYSNKCSKLLKSDNNFHWILHTTSNVPWPLQDRDLISEANMKQDTNCVITIKIQSRPNYVEENKGIIRIKYMHSEWQFTPKPNGIVIIQFKIKINLGGSVPLWIMNLFVDKGPFNTLSKMRENLELPKYKNAKVDYIREAF